MDIWLSVWRRLLALGLDRMRQPAPETLSLDPVFGLGRVTAAGWRVLEADRGIMDSLEGGKVVRMKGLGELACWGCWTPFRWCLMFDSC